MYAPPNLTPQQWARHPFVARISRYIELGKNDLESLRRLIESETTLRRKREHFIEGDRYRKICFVEDGFAARYKLLRNGKRQIVNVLVPGDVVGIPSSFLERAAWSVTAITDVKLQICSLEAFLQLCHLRPQIGLVLTWLTVHELAIYAEHITDSGRRTPLERLARFLLEIHERLSAVGRASASGFDLPFSQEVLGDALGLSVPHLNRMFAQLRAEGLITIRERKVEFADLRALQALGQFQPLRLARIPPPAKLAAN